MLRTALNMDYCVDDGKPLPLFIRRSGICDSLNITIWQKLRSKSMDAKLRTSLTSFFYTMYDSPVQLHQYPANVKLILHIFYIILQEMRCASQNGDKIKGKIMLHHILYRVAQNHGKQVQRISPIKFQFPIIQFVVIPHGQRDLSSLPWTGEAAVQIS